MQPPALNRETAAVLRYVVVQQLTHGPTCCCCHQGATDLIALLSLSAAKEGGESQLVSAIAIHNELLRRGRKVCTKYDIQSD